MKRITTPQTQPVSRIGATMVIALLALLFGSLVIAGLLRTVSMSHRQLKCDEFRMQAILLADAGCARAMTLLRTQQDFTDAIWNVPAGQLPSGRTAMVRMTVSPDPIQPTKRIVSVVAEYPLGHRDLVRFTRNVVMP